MIKGVLFDMDNTLIDWHGFDGNWFEMEREHLGKVLNFLETAGRPLEASLDDFAQTYTELTRDAWATARSTLRAPHMGKLLMQALAHYGFEPDETVRAADCIKAYDWKPASGVALFPDVIEGLDAILERGLKIGIVTNASQPMHLRDIELEAFGLLNYFPDATCRISAADVGYLKPNVKIFEYALQQLGTTAQETIYVGDNPVADIAGAQAAGLRAVLRINRETPPLISGLIVPDAAINSFTELLPLLDNWDAHVTQEK